MPTTFTYPGITDVESVVVNWSSGINPSTCSVVVPLSKLVGLYSGNLSFSYDGTSINWPGAIVSRHAISLGPERAHLADVVISDRRWRWKYGNISGWWNRRLGELSTIQSGYEKTPRELMTILLNEMGESQYDLTQVPNDPRPEVRWERSNPAQELQSLADSLGCRVVLNHLTNSVTIWKVGSGWPLPTIPSRLISPSASYGSLYRPDTVEVYSAPLQLDTRWTLEAVGEETDGTIKLIAALSYYPAETYYDPDMGNVIASEAAAVLARRTVYRMYRIKEATTPAQVPHTSLDDYEWETEQLLLHPTLNKRVPARCYGYFANEEAFEDDFEGWWEDDISIDSARRIVTFNRPCYRIVSNVPAAATMYLQTSAKVRTSDQHGYYRAYQSATVFGVPQQTDPMTIVREDVKYTRRHAYTGATTFTSETASDSVTHPQLLSIAQAEAIRLRPDIGGQGVYNGILPFELDGYRDRIMWSWGVHQPPQTVLVAKSETNTFIPGDEERRKNMALDRMLDRATAQQFKSMNKNLDYE